MAAKMKKEDSKDEKDGKNDKRKYASFSKRFGAFLIDIILVTFVASIVCIPFVNTNNQKKLESEYLENTNALFNNEINAEAYQEIQISYTYNIAKEDGLVSIVTILFCILYFGLLQFYMNGQTLGKKLFHIKIKSDTGELTINQLLFRALIIDSIILDLILFVSMMFTNKTIYYYTDLIFELIQYIIYFVCFIMIMKNKDKKGLHDVLFHTSVIEE